jgi:hypothetical protein
LPYSSFNFLTFILSFSLYFLFCCSMFNFRDASTLRLMGFDAATLRLAGFSDIAVLTSGYTAAELRTANFSTEQLRRAGLSDSALRVVGFQAEQQADVLTSLFRATDGLHWKNVTGWKELLKQKRLLNAPGGGGGGIGVGTNAMSASGLLPLQNESVAFDTASKVQLLQSCVGVTCDPATGEVCKIFLPSNYLRGTYSEKKQSLLFFVSFSFFFQLSRFVSVWLLTR